ncbi:MAG: hypothetical protein AAB036_05395 [Elusimicrobiota bacterium]
MKKIVCCAAVVLALGVSNAMAGGFEMVAKKWVVDAFPGVLQNNNAALRKCKTENAAAIAAGISVVCVFDYKGVTYTAHVQSYGEGIVVNGLETSSAVAYCDVRAGGCPGTTVNHWCDERQTNVCEGTPTVSKYCGPRGEGCP